MSGGPAGTIPLHREQRWRLSAQILVFAVVGPDEGVYEFGIVAPANGRVRIQKERSMDQRTGNETRYMRAEGQLLSRK